MAQRKRLAPIQGTLRHAVKTTLERHTKPGQKLLLAVSGGSDSMALAIATEFVAKKLGLEIKAAIIDHGLQKESSKVADQTAKVLSQHGIESHIQKVKVAKAGGPEAAARAARYQALEKIAKESGSDFIVLGHTHNDQAETVLLGLVRGSGSKSILGMREKTGIYLRPFLEIERGQTEEFCKASGIKYWLDPQNKDPKFLRVVVRTKVIPVLEKLLGPGVSKSLVRTAKSLQQDEDHLSYEAQKAFKKAGQKSGNSLGLAIDELAKLSPAILNRVLKIAIDSFGFESSRVHILAVSDLISNWHGQKPLSLPGVRVERKGKTIYLRSNQES